jgi:hypothetical protein
MPELALVDDESINMRRKLLNLIGKGRLNCAFWLFGVRVIALLLQSACPTGRASVWPAAYLRA